MLRRREGDAARVSASHRVRGRTRRGRFGRRQPGRRGLRDRRRHRSARRWAPRSPAAGRHAGGRHGRVLLARFEEGVAAARARRELRSGWKPTPRLDQVDRYGRLLRYLWRGGANVNLALVRQGAAAPYFYDGDQGRFADRLLVGRKGRQGRETRALGCVPRNAPRSVSPGRDAPEGHDYPRHRSAQRAAIRRIPTSASRRLRRISTAPTCALRRLHASSAPTRTASTATATASAARPS